MTRTYVRCYNRCRRGVKVMDDDYNDIMNLQRPVHEGDVFSRRHPKMARENRAKLFAPFAALSGFEEAVRSKEIPYVSRRVPDADETEALNRTLNRLHEATRTGALARQNRIRARVVYFEVCADVHHDAFGRDGLYRTVTGAVRKVDPVNRTLTIADRVIPFGDIDRVILNISHPGS